MIRPCPEIVLCPGTDDPITNYSSEASDNLDYVGRRFFPVPGPPLEQTWTATACGKTFISHISQIDADLMALAAAILCAHQNPRQPEPPGGPQTPENEIIFNTAQTCSVQCPDGNFFTYTLQPGLIAGFSQIEADILAKKIACQQAKLRRICLSDIQDECCKGTAFTATITATGGGLSPFPLPNLWDVVDGSLPPGLALHNSFGDPTAAISGTPTTAGTYTFTIQVTSIGGDYMRKQYTMCVIDISPSGPGLPDAIEGVAYTQALIATACAEEPLEWSIISGSFPPGLSINVDTGVISGTPSAGSGMHSYAFTIQAETGEGNICRKDYSITVNSTVTRCVQFDAATVAAINATYNPVTPWSGEIIVSFPNGIGGGSAIGIASITNNDASTITLQVLNVPATIDQWQMYWIWSTDGVLRHAQMGFAPNNLPYGGYSWDGVPGRPTGLPIFITLTAC